MFNRLLEDIDSYFERDPAARSRLEVVLCYPGFHALLFHRLNHCLWRLGLKTLARWLSYLGRFLTGIEIHPGATIGKHFFIDHGMGVVIGETAVIGDNVTMYHGVTLGGTSFAGGVRHPQIGDNVIIGAGAQLLGPIHVGDNARIGSNAVVTRDVPEGETMVGVPARRIRTKLVAANQEFDAYGTPHDIQSDPTRRDIETLMHEVRELKKKLHRLEPESGETAEEWEAE